MPKLKLFFLSLSMLLTCFLMAQSDNGFESKWSNGYKVASKDNNFKMKFGGRIMWDNAFFSQDEDLDAAFGELKNGNEFRRVRFFNSGSIYKNVKYTSKILFIAKIRQLNRKILIKRECIQMILKDVKVIAHNLVQSIF